MKTKILGGIYALAVMVAIGYGVNKSVQSNNADLNDLALANVEALAQNEGSTSYDCPGGENECVRVIMGNEVHIFYKP